MTNLSSFSTKQLIAYFLICVVGTVGSIMWIVNHTYPTFWCIVALAFCVYFLLSSVFTFGFIAGQKQPIKAEVKQTEEA